MSAMGHAEGGATDHATDHSAVGLTAHRLTRLAVHPSRGFERLDVALPCRVTFTGRGVREVHSVFALTRNLSRSGVLVTLQRAIEDIEYVAVELSPGAPPCPAIVRRRNDRDLACEFLEPLPAARLTELIASAMTSGGSSVGTGYVA